MGRTILAYQSKQLKMSNEAPGWIISELTFQLDWCLFGWPFKHT